MDRAACGEQITITRSGKAVAELRAVSPHGLSAVERREQKLVLAFRDYLERLGHDVVRLKIVPDGEAKPLLCDLIDRSTNILHEAKGTIERGAIRMAIGQLIDYRRFVEPHPKLAVLLPAEPRKGCRTY